MQPATIKRVIRVFIGLVAVLAMATGWVTMQNRPSFAAVSLTPETAPALQAEQIQRGAYLAQVGNCKACHTPRGGPDYIGGVGIETPFGSVMSSNLTPDDLTGIGRWSNADFWRAMHQGRSRDGRLLYPAFPYEHFTRITRQDSDAMWAYLKSLPAKAAPKVEHTLRFPYNTQAALAFWRALYFQPAASWQDDPRQSSEFNRGAYLVEGLGHCAACHSERNALGAVKTHTHLAGGLMEPQGWWAPALRWGQGATEAADTDPGESHAGRVRLLQTGVSMRKTLMGPMAQVVASSTQTIREPDLNAIVTYLQGLPVEAGASKWLAYPAKFDKAEPALMAQGSKLYSEHCAACHGEHGEGKVGAYPALAGNRGVTLAYAGNTVKAIQNGGYAPSTQANPMPYGMPPFRHILSDEEIAAVATYIRQSWGNQASIVRGVALEQGQ